MNPTSLEKYPFLQTLIPERKNGRRQATPLPGAEHVGVPLDGTRALTPEREYGRRQATPLPGAEHVGVPLDGTRSWRFRHGLWLLGVAALPKCVLCLLGYLALAGGLTGAASELCGATSGPDSGRFTWVAGILLAGVVGLAWWHRRRVSAGRRSDR